ncbi:MAG: hypothetical protein E1N59_1112 [Puniceicoccaceae bacterium 5H]|nr:MAG: hypothetical protein E1N59_1112 [Puniceicoccaceae bacterium 5H]
MEPRCFFLMPSAHPDSVALAELVSEDERVSARFQPAAAEARFFTFEDHDDLQQCRLDLEQALQRIRREANRREPMVVNPTSGTKQMSAAATMAALDAEADEIVFITGPRENGVVITGEEQIQKLDTSQFYAEQAAKEARRLLAAGAFHGAAEILKPWRDRQDPTIDQIQTLAQVLHEWQRLNYGTACQCAARPEMASFTALRRWLSGLRQAPELDPAILADLLDACATLLHWNRVEEALAYLYRSTELAGKLALKEAYALEPPYQEEDLAHLLPRRRERFRALARDGKLHLGLREIWEILRLLKLPLAEAYFGHYAFRTLIEARNQTVFGHGTVPAEIEEVQGALQHLCQELDAQPWVMQPACRRLQLVRGLHM